MSQPTPYAPAYDFSDFQALSPSTPLPAPQLDTELAALAITLTGVLANLALIQRDDGALANASVTPDTLSAEVVDMIGEWNPRGDWLTAIAYAKLDMVTSAAALYVCVTAHTSGVFATDLAAGRWQLLTTVGANAVGNAQMAQMAAGTIKGNNTGALADPIDLTAAQALAMLSALVGDSGAGGTKGLAPAPGAGDAAANKFLKASGAYAAIQSATTAVSGISALTAVADVLAGTDTAKAVTADALASLWQKGADIASAGTLVKPADASRGGYHFVTGGTGITALWAGDPDGSEVELRFTGAPLLTNSATFALFAGANVQIAAGDIIRFRYEVTGTVWRAVGGVKADGTSWVASSARKPVPVRQTVLSGPLTAAGLPSFGGSTGSTTVTASGTIVATAANGADVSGQLDRVGSKSNPSWTGLSTNGTMYLYFDVNSDGTMTEGSTAVAPVYQFGGTPAVTSGRFTFNIQEMAGYVGNGASAPQTYRVFVGEVTVAGAVVTAIKWYSLMGRYISTWTPTLPGPSAFISFNHNLGTTEGIGVATLEFECTTIDNGYAVGDKLRGGGGNNMNNMSYPPPITITSTNAGQISTGGFGWASAPKAGGNSVALTVASWKYRFIFMRGW